MKKHISIILISLVATIYVSASIGISVISHYCGGKLENTSLFSEPPSCCGDEEIENDNNCCKNETNYISFQKDFTFYAIIKNIKASVQQLFSIYSGLNFIELKYTSFHFLVIDKKFHPPDLVQHQLISCSVIKI